MTIHIPGNNQTIFDRVCAHLARQGRRAIKGNKCQYQTPDGLRCAIGGLLPDDADFELLNSQEWPAIRSLIEDNLIAFECDTDLVQRLQNAHDSPRGTTASILRNELTAIAFFYNLSPAAAEQITRWDA